MSLHEEKRLVETLITGKPAVKAYTVATISILIIMACTLFYWQGSQAWTSLLPAINSKIFQHSEIWRAFTAILIHSDIEHLFSNMYMLWIFVFFIYGYFGFTVFPIVSFFAAAIVNIIAVRTYAPDIQLLGASGLVYLLGGFWLTLYWFIQRQYSWSNRLIRVSGITLMIFWPSTFVVTTSYRTHAIGFLAGVVMGGIYFWINKDKIRDKEVYNISLV